jgi:Tfp pilus assembly protein PilV
MHKKQQGFSLIIVLVLILVVGAIGFAGWRVTSKNKTNSTPSQTSEQSSEKSAQSGAPERFIWQQTANGWQASETPPDCPAQPMLKAPADLSKVTSVLYPGQTRGSYKPHGGLRFDNSANNAITVTSPMDGFIIKGVSVIVEGEIQYGFDVMNNCGVMYRIGHLREISADMHKIADTWPAPTEDSRNQNVNPAVAIKQGDLIGTKVGILKSKNAFFDFGVYDYRQTNGASKSAAYQATHQQDKEVSWHAVCWFQGWLPDSDQATLTALPGGAAGSKDSDYCK